MDVEEFLGLDIGQKRIGVARGSTAARIAEPVTTIPADDAMNELKKIIKKHKSGGVVAGLPRSLDGNETEQTAWVRAWVDSARKKIELPFYWQDEALTSQKILEQGGEGKDVDALAAALILQDFLDASAAERVHV